MLDSNSKAVSEAWAFHINFICWGASLNIGVISLDLRACILFYVTPKRQWEIQRQFLFASACTSAKDLFLVVLASEEMDLCWLLNCGKCHKATMLIKSSLILEMHSCNSNSHRLSSSCVHASLFRIFSIKFHLATANRFSHAKIRKWSEWIYVY